MLLKLSLFLSLFFLFACFVIFFLHLFCFNFLFSSVSWSSPSLFGSVETSQSEISPSCDRDLVSWLF
jgi:hypothetical protein